MLQRTVVLLSALLFCTACLVGCGSSGPQLGTVTGKVTLDGAPLADATVQFQPAEGKPSYAVTDASGNYELLFAPDQPGATLGKHTVEITGNTYSEDAQGNEVQLPQKVPGKYNQNSELTADVKAGSNTFNFELKSE